MNQTSFEQRKRDHLELAMDPAHEAFGLSGLEKVVLPHEAIVTDLPEEKSTNSGMPPMGGMGGDY